MKNIFIFISICLSITRAQNSYPLDNFLGGGIGYSPMYIMLDSIPGASHLTKLGLDSRDFKDPFVIHGGEGFAHVAGRWRIGGYAGIGATSISTVPSIVVYEELNDTTGYQPPGDPSNPQPGEDGSSKDYTKFFNPTIEAKFTFSLGATSVEYVIPILQDLELSAGALMGLGRAGISIDQQSGNPRWKDTFTNVYGIMDTTGTLFYGVDSANYLNPDIIPGEVPGLMRDVSATFFNFQPYIAVKWQFLERVGLRISVGFNKGTVRAGNYELNGRTRISDSPSSAIQGTAFRTMLYIGL
jgi:hypothetical protein